MFELTNFGKSVSEVPKRKKKYCSVTQDPIRLGTFTVAKVHFLGNRIPSFVGTSVAVSPLTHHLQKKKSSVLIFSDEHSMTCANCQIL